MLLTRLPLCGGTERGVLVMSTSSELRAILFLCVAGLVMSSCDMDHLMEVDPDPTSMVDGQVLFGDDQPAPGVEVVLRETAILDEWPTIIKTTRTDSSGRFRIEFAHDGHHTYLVVVEGMYASSKESRVSLRPGENQDVVLRYYRSP